MKKDRKIVGEGGGYRDVPATCGGSRGRHMLLLENGRGREQGHSEGTFTNNQLPKMGVLTLEPEVKD